MINPLESPLGELKEFLSCISRLEQEAGNPQSPETRVLKEPRVMLQPVASFIYLFKACAFCYNIE